MITFLKYQVGKVSLQFQQRKLKRAIFRANRNRFEQTFGLAVRHFNLEKSCFSPDRVRFAAKRNKVEI